MNRTSRRGTAAGTALAVVALLAAAPRPAEAVRQLRDAGAATADPTAPLVAAVSLLAWALAAWLLVTVVLTLVARRRGTAGRLAGAVVRRVAPVAVRRAVEVALGLTVVVGGVASPAVAAVDLPATPGAPAASLDWAGTPAPGLDWPTAAPPAESAPATSVRAVPVPAADAPTVVERGDTLWDLAEQSLDDRQGSPPTTGQVAAEWPRWWAANREAVGEDPDHLLPGTPLTPPGDAT